MMRIELVASTQTILEQGNDTQEAVASLSKQLSAMGKSLQRTRTKSLTDMPLQEVRTATEAASLIASSEKVIRG
jgi:hypothetical protein